MLRPLMIRKISTSSIKTEDAILVRGEKRIPNAFDFLDYYEYYYIDVSIQVKPTTPASKRKKKASDSNETEIFLQPWKDALSMMGFHTFFIPVLDAYPKVDDKPQIDQAVARRHVVKDSPLFTNAITAQHVRESLAALKGNESLDKDVSGEGRDDDILYEYEDESKCWLSFQYEKTSRYVYAKSVFKEEAKKDKKTTIVEFAQSDIPVSNGVVHLIRHFLCTTDESISAAIYVS
uniref:Uncharacterized protein n=1 Tax=Glossina brevipalpis TaxID=37001 RepID=A0A1A9WIU2_9MUSC